MTQNTKYNICYWCGEKATSKEHVPPSNIFPKHYRHELITVGACKKHNEEFSKLDERMRFNLTFVSKNEIGRAHYKNKSIKGLKRPESSKLLLDLSNNFIPDHKGENLQKESPETLNKYFEKIIRGLYFHHHSKPLNGSTSYFSSKVKQLDLNANIHFYFYCISSEGKWIEGDSKNPDIFKYYYRYSSDMEQFFLKMFFFDDHEICGVTVPVDKTINDYALSYDEYKERMEKW